MPVILDAPRCAGCGAPTETSYPRHLTDLEYAAIPPNLRPIDGYAVRPVEVCGDCHPGPICAHPAADPVPCPVCHAQPGASCTKPDGSQRAGDHPARLAAQPVTETCRHAHRPDCTDPATCQCTGDDPAPERIPGVPVEPPEPDLRAIPQALDLIDKHQLRPELMRSEVRLGWTQDNRRALLFDYAQPDDTGRPARDVNGHEIVTRRVIPVEG